MGRKKIKLKSQVREDLMSGPLVRLGGNLRDGTKAKYWLEFIYWRMERRRKEVGS